MNRLAISCVIAALGIGLGAFGAHGLEPTLIANGSEQTWRTATLYHLVHAVALFVLAASPTLSRCRRTFWLWTAGILLFSGSLYLLSLTKWSVLGPVTPLGGLAFIGGWIYLIFESKGSSKQ